METESTQYVVLVDGNHAFSGTEMDCYLFVYLLIDDPLSELLASEYTSTLRDLCKNYQNANVIQVNYNDTPVLTYIREVTLATHDEQYNSRNYCFIRQ